MLAKNTWLKAALCLLLSSDVARAGLEGPMRRADTTSVETAATGTTDTTAPTQTATTTSTGTDDAQTTTSAPTSVIVTSSRSSTATTAVPSALNGNTVSNHSSIFGNCKSWASHVLQEMPIPDREQQPPLSPASCPFSRTSLQAGELLEPSC